MVEKITEAEARKFVASAVLLILIILSFFLLKPILLSIITGLILAFVFMPLYKRAYKFTKSKNISAILISILLLIIILLPFWFLTPLIVEQSLKVYLSIQQMDFVGVIKTFLPNLPETFLNEFGNVAQSFTTKLANSLTNALSNLILNFPVIFLHLVVVAFTFFFALRDGDKLIEYIKSLSPFSKDVEKKLFDYSKGITESVIYGQIITGILQGILAGAGFFIFGVPNALFLTLLAIIASILPIIGPIFVWVPVLVYLLLAGNIVAGFGVLFFGLISSSIDNFLRPIIVSRKTQMPLPLILIGMIGGLFLFGILGFILGPLILGFLLIILEIYRNKKPTLFLEEGK